MDIDFPLLETTRPPMYKGDKYVGKKPHNIWSQYIESYTSEKDIVLDIFGGSGVCAIESLILGRRAITNDLNPMHRFGLEVFLKKFEEDNFLDTYKKLLKNFKDKAKEYKFFNTKCTRCSNESPIIKTNWDDKGNTLKIIGYECKVCPPIPRVRNKYWYEKRPDSQDLLNFSEIENFQIPYWHPTKDLPNLPEIFSTTFLRDLGENKYGSLWSKQNLLILSYEFNEILKIDDENVKHHLLFAFLKSLRLCFGKQNDPRDPARGNRDWATSWGRSGFAIFRRQIHLNPILQFERAVEGTQGLIKILKNKTERLGDNISYTFDPNDFFENKKQLLILTNDCTTLDNLIPENSVDFILTDPPYGATVPYFSMESVYTCWLEKIDQNYRMDFDNELAIRNRNYEEYQSKFMRTFKGASKILKKNKKIVVTFHSQDLKIWSLLHKSFDYSGFSKEKIIFQPNMRSGETVAANKYSQTSNDFYFRYKNERKDNLDNEVSFNQIENIILREAKELLKEAAEPMPKPLLFVGIINKLFYFGYSLQVSNNLIDQVLFREINTTLEVEGNKRSDDSIWSLKNYEYDHIPLSQRTETIVRDIIVRENIVSFDEIYKKVMTTFSDHLTPFYRSLPNIIEKFGERITTGENKGKWKLKIRIRNEASEHDLQIGKLAEIGKAIGFNIWIGRNEQGHVYKEGKLSDYINPINLEIENYSDDQLHEIKNIDLIWYKNKKICAIFEIEHSTSITSALYRGAQINDNTIKRYIIMKQQGSQRTRLNRRLLNPWFTGEFDRAGWVVKYYNDVSKDYKKVITQNGSSKFV